MLWWEDNPGRVEPLLQKGDVVIVLAGVGRRLLKDHGGFQMVGSYPIGKIGICATDGTKSTKRSNRSRLLAGSVVILFMETKGLV